MAERVTRWKPDTCGCVIEYAWDDSLADEDISLTCVAFEACEEHVALADQPLAAAMEAVLQHNRLGRDEP